MRLKKNEERQEKKAAKANAERYRENAARLASEVLMMRKNYKVPRFSSGELCAELLHRSRYLFYKLPQD